MGFLISLIFTLVNVCSTPISFWTVERFGRRPLLIYGALGMLICQFLVAIIGVSVGFNHTHPDPSDPDTSIANNISAVNAQIAFIAIFIFFFASTWSWCLDRHRRDLPSPHPLSRCRSLHCLQLAVEHHHRCHHSLHGWRRQGQPALFRLLHLGWSLHLRFCLRLLPCP